MARGLATYRPLVQGATHMVSAANYLAAAAGYRILEDGGNAIDAGVAAGIVLNVVQPHMTSFGGVAPIILYSAQADQVATISGLGRWPRAASAEHFVREQNGEIPLGVLRCVTPAAAAAWLTALERFGTMTFAQVVQPGLELAEGGFPVTESYCETAAQSADILRRWPETAQVFLPGGRVPQMGDVLVQKDLARTFRRLVDVEQANAPKGRTAALRAARDEFYQGDIARQMVTFVQEQGGFLTMEDLRDFHVGVEAPVSGTYRDYTVYTCGPWCQGPVVIQALHLLEGYDLPAFGHNSTRYAHVVLEALKLAFSDRHFYYGDPDLVDVPIGGLLPKEYATARREAIDERRACPEMPEPGDPWPYEGRAAASVRGRPQEVRGPHSGDTSYVCVVDRWGNVFSATPSDSFAWVPLVPGLGLAVSGRGSQTWLEEGHPSRLEPWKRPRLTPNPAIAFKDGKPWMPFGTPGGDMQCQAMVQTFLNVVEFGMGPQRAIEAPRVSTWSFPNSFWPHGYRRGVVALDGRISQEVARGLDERGHRVEGWDDWSPVAGCMCAITIDRQRGVLTAGADIRREASAVGR